MSKKNELLIRLYIVLVFVVITAIALFVKAAQISVIEGDHWRAKGDSLYLKYMPVEADRGNILADDGSLLATSLPFFEIRMDLHADGLKDEIFRKHVDSLAWYLSKYANRSWTQHRYRNYLVQQRAKGNRYLLISKSISYSELEKFKQFPLFRLGRFRGGFIVERRSHRAFPYKELAARTLGSVRPGAQPVGIEGYYDDKLAGEEGQRLMQRVSGGTWIPVSDLSEIEAKRGMDVHTTINVRYQDIVHNALLKAVQHHNARYGTAILMDVKTGAIKAISNLSANGNGAYTEDFNFAVGASIEPGSTMKLASVMALLEDSYADLDTKVRLNGGYARFYNRDLRDSEPHGLDSCDMRKAFEVSSNVGIATLINDAYGKTRKAEEYIARLKQFGLNRTTGIKIPGEEPPFIKEAYNNEQRWSGTTLPWMSIGYELEITPLQMLSFYNAVANDGRMMKPYIVEAILRDGRKVVQKFKPEVVIERIASEETIMKAHELLEGVALRGTASRQQSELVSFAGKTGTSLVEYFLPDNGRKKYQSSFAGFFPVGDPQYSCIVVVNDPKQYGYYGSAVALPAFREIAEKLAVIEYDKAAFARVDTTVKQQQKHLPEVQFANRSDVENMVSFLDLRVDRMPESQWVALNGEEKLEAAEIRVEERQVPDLRGMGLKDALYLLENAGLKVKVRGVGKVRRQSLQAGTPVTEGASIELQLG